MTKFRHPEKPDNEVFYEDQMITIHKIDQGGILGLDVINPNSKHSTNVKVTRDFTVLYRIKLDFLKGCDILVLRYLRSLYNIQQELIQNALKREQSLIEKKKIKANARKRSLSTENIMIDNITQYIKSFTQPRVKSKRNVKMNLTKQKPKILFQPLLKGVRSTSLNATSVKANKHLKCVNKVSTPAFNHSMTHKLKKTQSQVSLIKAVNKTDLFKDEVRKDIGLRRFNTFITLVYSNNNYNKFNRYSSYNTGNFDLPLVG